MNFESISLILSVLVCLLLIICVIMLVLLLKSKNSKDYGQNQTVDEIKENTDKAFLSLSQQLERQFSQSRLENTQSQSAQRQEINTAINQMSQRIEKTARDNFEFNAKATQAIAQSLEKIRDSNEKSLESIRSTVDEKLNETLTSRLNSSFRSVSEQLENVYKSLGEMKVLSGNVTQNVNALNRVLTNVKTRGTWAEVQLDTILSDTIPGMYEKNAMPNRSSREIVEFAVKIPSGETGGEYTLLPIDSKFPVEDYIRLCKAADEGDEAAASAARKALEARILAQAKEISKYINEPETTPFAIMYLATEGLYNEALSSENAVAEKCQTQYNVLISGPSTITALLTSLSVGFKAVAVNEKAKQVRDLLAAARMQYDKFGILLERARKKINEAGKSLDDAQSRNGIIQKKLKSAGEIESKEAEQILGLDEESADNQI
ncbi:MAG: DNA recombination protein RmuC [Oscillospiraceae bacterium]|nr:DNA recombination protein RmuC [Oscillospiraceae bacterium]